MTGPSSIVRPPSLPGVLRQHRERLRDIEAPGPGSWVYVLPLAPAATPADFLAHDPLAPVFKNSWTNVAGSQAVSFRIHPETVVVIRGVVTGGSLPSIVFTLPEKFRPDLVTAVVFPNQDGSSIYTGRVDPNGDVWLLAQIT